MKIVTLGEALSLTTPQGAIKGKLLWVFRSPENTFAGNAHRKMLSDNDGHTKPQPQSPCTFMQVSLYTILLSQNSNIVFPWSDLHLELSQKFLL